jgi:hypothetical protein
MDTNNDGMVAAAMGVLQEATSEARSGARCARRRAAPRAAAPLGPARVGSCGARPGVVGAGVRGALGEERRPPALCSRPGDLPVGETETGRKRTRGGG